MKNIAKVRKLRRGLTLIELAVVVLILGAIITLVAININPGELKDSTAALKLKKDASELPLHLERYAAKFGTYPSEDQGLKALVEKPSSGDVPPNWSPMVKGESTIQDPWGTEYQLRQDQYGGFEIITLGKDKAPGGAGANADFNILAKDQYPEQFRK